MISTTHLFTAYIPSFHNQTVLVLLENQSFQAAQFSSSDTAVIQFILVSINKTTRNDIQGTVANDLVNCVLKKVWWMVEGVDLNFLCCVSLMS